MTATFNRKAIQAAAGYLYLVATPASVVATTPATIVKELLENFYVDGTICGALKAGIVPWKVLDANGLNATIKQTPVKVKTNDGPDETIGYEDVSFDGDTTVLDVDVQVFKDLLSAVSAHVLETVASATQAGRDTLLGGGQRNVTTYLGLYRYESREFPGEFRNVLIPAIVFNLDGASPMNKAKARELKVKFTAQDSGLLYDPITNKPVIWIEDYVTAAKAA
ncbi:MAG: hypothetical protein P4L11_13705 [Geothrix sp.]|nr:hypothetical protein [Geothrix sp.]